MGAFYGNSTSFWKKRKMEKLYDEKNELSAVKGGVMHGTASREWRPGGAPTND